MPTDGGWSGTIQRATDEAIPLPSLLDYHLRPTSMRPWPGALDRHVVLDAVRVENTLELVIASDPGVAESIRAGLEVRGPCVWAMSFRDSPEGVVLEKSRMLRPADGAGGDSDLPGVPPVLALGREFRVVGELRAGAWVRLGETSLPVSVCMEWPTTVVTARVRESSIRDVVDARAFSFEVPSRFGPDGRLRDLETGEVRAYGSTVADADGATSRAVEAARRLGERDDGSVLPVVLLAVLAAAGAVVLVRGRKRRRK